MQNKANYYVNSEIWEPDTTRYTTFLYYTCTTAYNICAWAQNEARGTIGIPFLVFLQLSFNMSSKVILSQHRSLYVQHLASAFCCCHQHSAFWFLHFAYHSSRTSLTHRLCVVYTCLNFTLSTVTEAMVGLLRQAPTYSFCTANQRITMLLSSGLLRHSSLARHSSSVRRV